MKYTPIILSFLFLSCKPQQIITKTKYVHDSIYIDKIEKIYVPQTQIVEIESPCDSLGNLKPFKTLLKSDKVNITVESKNGVITAKIDLDTIKEVYQKEFRSNKIKDAEVIEIKVKQPLPKWIWYSLGLNVGGGIWLFKKQIFNIVSTIFPTFKILKIAKNFF